MSIKNETDELSRMIEAADDRLDKNVIPKGEETPELMMEPIFNLDFEKLRKECDSKAKKMIKAATGFVLTDEIIKQNPYLKNKMQVDVISLSGMLYQLRVNQQMQESLMEEVRKGAAHPRMFEVFGKLSDTIGNLNKQLLQTVEAIKSTYKDIKFDVRERDNELKAIGPGQNGMMRNDKGLISMGTKELINETKRLKQLSQNTSEIQDIEEIKPE